MSRRKQWAACSDAFPIPVSQPWEVKQRLCLVLTCALCCVIHTTAQPRQEPNIDKWVRWTDPPQVPQRYWNRAMLSAATAVPNHLQLGPVIDKLNKGQNITVVVFGTSITSDCGGCFNPDLVPALVAVPPHVHIRKKCWNSGWLNRFMTEVNTTWPASGHVVINMGYPTATMGHRAVGSCLEVSLPKTADLIILESLAGLDGGGPGSGTMMERLVTRLYHHFGVSVPVILVHTLSVVSPWEQPELCIRERNCSSCASNFTHKITSEGNFGRPYESVLNVVAEYYGFTTISTRNFYHNILRNGIPVSTGPEAAAIAKFSSPAANVSRDEWFCQVLSETLGDHVHPRYGMGSQLLADLLHNHLIEAELQLLSIREPLLPMHFPKQPLHPGGHDTFVFRCYGHHQDAMTSESEVVAPMETTKREGWEWVEYQMHGEVKKLKPGWVATAPGAVLQMVVNTTFEQQLQAMVGLTYLVSYEHMGMARVSCAGGCACEPFELNAHDPGNKVSVLATRDFNVTQAPQCMVQVDTLTNTTSGQNKFKVVRIYVKVAMGPLGGIGNASKWL